MGAYLLKQVAGLFDGKGLGPVLFGGNQDALRPDDEQITDQVGGTSLEPRPMYSCSKRGTAIRQQRSQFRPGFSKKQPFVVK